MSSGVLKTRGHGGFTLIELIVVLLVISVLAGIAVQNYRKVLVHAEAAALSHALHVYEDQIIERATLNYEAVRSSHADQLLGALDLEAPQAPEGVRINLGKSNDHEIMVFVVGVTDFGHQVIEALATMRPITAHDQGTFIVEAIDIRAAQVEPVAQPAGSGAGS